MSAASDSPPNVLITDCDHGDVKPESRVLDEAGFEICLAEYKTASDVVGEAREATGRRGVDLVVDTSGAEGAISAGVGMLRRRGRICAVGGSGRESVHFPWVEALFQAIDLRFGFSSPYTSRDAAPSLIRSGAVDAEALTTFSRSTGRVSSGERQKGGQGRDHALNVRPGGHGERPNEGLERGT